MMNYSVKTRLFIMAATSIISVVALSIMGYQLGKHAAIGSTPYQKIYTSLSLISDVATPPLYMAEATMHVNQIDSSPKTEREALTKEVQQHLAQFKDSIDKWKANETLPPELKEIISRKLAVQGERYIRHLEDHVLEPARRGDDAAFILGLNQAKALFDEHEEIATDLAEKASAYLTHVQKEGEATVDFYDNLLLFVAVISVALVLFFSLIFSRAILRGLGAEPDELKRITNAIAKGQLDIRVEHTSDDSVLSSVANMLGSLKESASHAVDNHRVRQALEATSSNIMVADGDRNIVFMNNAVERMLRAVEADLRKALPHFSVDKVLGSNMDIFHRNPAHQSTLLANLRETYISNITVAGLSFRLIANPIFDENGERLGSVVEWLDRTKEVAAEQHLARVLGALETTSTNVMIADADRKIIYMNKAVENMLRIAESDLRTALPHFAVDKVVGSTMDIFHKNPAHQMKLLETFTTTYTSNIVVGRRHFRLIANPIFSKNGERIGSVVEWLDRTQEVAVEAEVNHLVESAAAGDFTVRIKEDGKDGFLLKLVVGLNSLVDTANKGLNDVSRVLGAISKGDLSEKIEQNYSGTFGDLKDFCNNTTANLSEMLGEIRSAADTIFTASSEIASGNADLSSRTEQQAANLEETASSMEELTSTVKLNADNAKQANMLAEQAASVATDGGDLIQKVVSTMDEINDSAKKISDIIGVIDGIAFQTNILALNAAVEAARAGDQGRGFAVVASEVRTLAQRSANAAKDIKGLISDSVSKIDSGNSLVRKSGDTMKDIVTAIKRVNDIMAEIAAASAEQSTGIDEISTAVSQMDEMTQQNAALVEEAAAAAESLQSQADQLTQRVSQFRLANDTARQYSTPPRSTPRIAATKRPSATPTKHLAPPSDVEDEWESF